MEFQDITLFNMTYQYAVKIEQKFKQKKQDFGSTNPKQWKGVPKLQNQGQSQGRETQDSPSKLQDNKNTMKSKKDRGKWCEFHKIPNQNTNECRDKQFLVAKLND